MIDITKLSAYDAELVTNLLGAVARCDNNARLRLLKSTMFVEPHARVPVYEDDAWTPEGDVLGAYRELLYGFLNPSVRRVSAGERFIICPNKKLNTDLSDA